MICDSAQIIFATLKSRVCAQHVQGSVLPKKEQGERSESRAGHGPHLGQRQHRPILRKALPFRRRFGRSAAATPRVIASKPTASTAIWTISALRSAGTIRISATGSRTLRLRRSKTPISVLGRNTGCFSKRSKVYRQPQKRGRHQPQLQYMGHYHKSIDHLRAFMHKEYNVSDMPLAELEQSFIEQYSMTGSRRGWES